MTSPDENPRIKTAMDNVLKIFKSGNLDIVKRAAKEAKFTERQIKAFMEV